MPLQPTRKRYYGWYIVAASVIGVALSQAPIVYLSLGVFMIPLQQSFGWDRGKVSLGLSVGALTLALSMPAVGRLIDKYGARRVLLPSMAMFSIATMSLYFLSGSFWHYLCMFALIGVVGSGSNTMTYARVLAAWYDRLRGMALGFAMSGIGLGSALSPVIAQAIINGHRLACRLPRTRPVGARGGMADPVLRDARLAAGHRAAPGGGATLCQTTGRIRRCVARPGGNEPPWRGADQRVLDADDHFFHRRTHRARSADPSCTTVARQRLVGQCRGRRRRPDRRGYFCQPHRQSAICWINYFAPRVGLVVFLCPLIAMAVVGHANTVGLALASATLLGIGSGAESDLMAYLVSRYFGIKCFAEIYGYTYGALMLGTAIGPYLWGLTFDLFHSYQPALWVALGGIVMICLLLLLFRPFPDWRRQVAAASG